ncbi:MAG: protein TolQ [Nitrospinae bacterium]|nr:protein TolQ [Nitrospinota bacterium]
MEIIKISLNNQIIATIIDNIINRGFSEGVAGMIAHAGWMAKFVLIILLFFSIGSWAIIIQKFRALKKAEKETNKFLKMFKEGKSLSDIYLSINSFKDSPVATVFRSGYTELVKRQKGRNLKEIVKGQSQRIEGNIGNIQIKDINAIEAILKRSISKEIALLEKALNFLATTASTTPFIGLFGTVWGVMNSFRSIGVMGSASIAGVAPGISEALIATAAGLSVAIPAVMAYNYFISRIKAVRIKIDDFSQEFISIIEKDFVV